MNLTDLYGELASRLPTHEDDEPIKLDKQSIDRPAASLETDSIVVMRGRHQYLQSVVVDRALFFAEPSRYRELGLLLLAVLFHDDLSEVQLQLTAPPSQIKLIKIRYQAPGVESFYGYADTPKALMYDCPYIDEEFGGAYVRRGYSDSAGEHPFVQLTTPSENWSADRPAEKTEMIGFSTPADTSGRGLAAAAQVFLDLGAPRMQTEINLELDDGEMAPWSAELRMYLPGNRAFADAASWRDQLLVTTAIWQGQYLGPS